MHACCSLLALFGLGAPHQAHKNEMETFDDPDTVKRKWTNHSSSERDRLGMSASSRPWTSRPDVSLRGVPDRARVRATVDIGWGARLLKAAPGTNFENLRKGYYIDVTQAIQRKKYGSTGTLTQGTKSKTSSPTLLALRCCSFVSNFCTVRGPSLFQSCF
jgi:hypothetical protein